MKNVICVIVAVALGVIAGLAMKAPAVQRLRNELARAHAETAELKDQLERARRAVNGRTRFNNDAPARVPAPPMPDAVSEGIIEDVETSTVVVVEAPAPSSVTDVDAERDARMQAFMDRLRQQTAEERVMFVESQQLNERQVQTYDSIMGNLNQRVGDIAEQWADYIRQTGKMENDYGMRMMHDVSGAMVEAYDAMDASFPSWRNSMPRGGMGWVDPSAYAPIIEAVQSIGGDMRNFRMPGVNVRPQQGGGGGPPQRQRGN